ncbi:MAG: hemerythrin domain-containing protein [Thiohalocapsa sp.]
MPDSIAETLTADHRRCDQLLARIESAANRADWQQTGQESQQLAKSMENHFAFEEQTLFPPLEAAAPMASGPTGVMRQEHAQLRQLIVDLQAAVLAGDADECLGLIETLHFAIQQHNAKEEAILYPLADQALATEAAALLSEFAD